MWSYLKMFSFWKQGNHYYQPLSLSYNREYGNTLPFIRNPIFNQSFLVVTRSSILDWTSYIVLILKNFKKCKP